MAQRTTSSRLTFNADEHVYKLDGAPTPSVTQALHQLHDFSNIPPDRLKRAREFGIAVHTMCELHDQGDMDDATLHLEYLPYLEAWQAFRRDMKLDMVAIEEPVFHGTWHYAGTPDRIAVDASGTGVVIDIKRTYVIDPIVDLQTAAYMYAWNDMRGTDGPKVLRRFCVQLKDTGNYKVRDCDERESAYADFSTYLACLQVHKWKLKNK